MDPFKCWLQVFLCSSLFDQTAKSSLRCHCQYCFLTLCLKGSFAKNNHNDSHILPQVSVTQTNAFWHCRYFIRRPRPHMAERICQWHRGRGLLVTEHVSSHLLIGICHVISGEVNNMPIRPYVLQSNEIGLLSVNLSGSRHVFIT